MFPRQRRPARALLALICSVLILTRPVTSLSCPKHQILENSAIMSVFGKSAGSSVFGQPQQQNASPFGGVGSTTSQAPPGTGLFGSSLQPPAQSGGLFGNSQQNSGGGLFGSAQSQPQAGGGLFGSSQPASQGGGLFGSTQPSQPQQQPQQSGGGLFGNLGSTNNQTQQLQSQPQQQQQPQQSSILGQSSLFNPSDAAPRMFPCVRLLWEQR